MYLLRYLVVALLSITKTEDGSLPKRIPVCPAGALIKGEDGRAWSAKDRPAVLARLNAAGRKLVLDENHSMIRSAPKGGPSPALALLSDFREDAAGVVYAETVEWTKYGEANAPNYVGISPVLKHRAQRGIFLETEVLGDLTDLHSVSLVNDPNLELPALNDREITQETDEMTPEQLAAALAPFTAAITALTADVAALKAKPVETETVIAPNNAEAKVKLELSINSCLQKHVDAGKIKPDDASAAYFRTMATSEETLATMDAHYTAQKPLVALESISSNSQDGTGSKLPALAADTETLIRNMGWDKQKLFGESAAK